MKSDCGYDLRQWSGIGIWVIAAVNPSTQPAIDTTDNAIINTVDWAKSRGDFCTGLAFTDPRVAYRGGAPLEADGRRCGGGEGRDDRMGCLIGFGLHLRHGWPRHYQ